MKAQTRSLSVPSGLIHILYLSVLSLAFLLVQISQVHARGAPESFADLAEAVSPSVVNITTTTLVEFDDNMGPVIPEGSPFEDFFRDFQDRQQQQPGERNRTRRSQALGSGFIISADGYVVTNNHVIEDADEIMIELFSGGELDAKLIGRDPKTDIALLKVDVDEPLPFVSFGDSDVSRVGDWVMAVGNPLGQGFSVSAGIISARNRELSGTYDDYIQTDAAINRGNSGGPLFNMDGQVIGVNTAILSPDGGSIGIGFSMASNVVSRVVDQLQEFGETRRGWLGVRIQDVTSDMAEALGLESTVGAMVTDVPDGPALDAGMEAGDIILTFDGRDVRDVRDLVNQVGNAPVGKTVDVEVLRNGDNVVLSVTLGRRELAEGELDEEELAEEEQVPQETEILGLSLMVLDDAMRTDLGLDDDDEGLFVSRVDENSEAFEKGLRAGDIIEKAGQRRIETIEDFEAQIAAAKDAGRKSILLLVRSGGNPRFIALSVKD